MFFFLFCSAYIHSSRLHHQSSMCVLFLHSFHFAGGLGIEIKDAMIIKLKFGGEDEKRVHSGEHHQD